MDLIEVSQNNKLRHPWETVRFDFIFSQIEKNLQIENPVILDIGCGDSFFLQKMSNKVNGFYHAVDSAFTDKEIDKLNATTGESIQYYNSLNSFKENYSGKLDLILLLDVIEHIEHDILFLKSLIDKNYVSEKTLIFISVPAHNFLFSDHDRFLKHYRRYNRNSLSKTINEAGLISIDQGNFFFALFLIRSFLVLFQKLFNMQNTQKGIGSWKYGPLITNTLIILLNFETKITLIFKQIKINIPGLSTYALCKKSV